jgi:uncharacterized protein (UPF0548 family)
VAVRRRVSLAALADAQLTYEEWRATRGVLPPGYRHVELHVLLGTGVQAFELAGNALMAWQMHRRAGLAVTASSAVVADDAVVVLGLGWGPIGVAAPCRVVYVVDQPRRRGFAYGTLPGHPERGEEAFTVGLDSAGQVWGSIKAFSRPASWLAGASGPIGRWIQTAITARYVRALRDIAQPEPR